MKLNLRKARKLEQKIMNYTAKNNLDTNLDVLVTKEAKKVAPLVFQSRDKFQDKLNSYIDLITLAYKIREMIGSSNEKSKINLLMNKRAMAAAKAELLDSYITLDQSPSTEELEIMLSNKKKMLEEGSRYGTAKYKVPILHKSDLDNMKKAGRDYIKEIEEIDDEIAKKNLSTNILLDEKDVKLLELFELV
jgi:viroplasmin and RNaseH domain-containing protein